MGPIPCLHTDHPALTCRGLDLLQARHGVVRSRVREGLSQPSPPPVRFSPSVSCMRYCCSPHPARGPVGSTHPQGRVTRSGLLREHDTRHSPTWPSDAWVHKPQDTETGIALTLCLSPTAYLECQVGPPLGTGCHPSTTGLQQSDFGSAV